jgi:hypothetical protein
MQALHAHHNETKSQAGKYIQSRLSRSSHTDQQGSSKQRGHLLAIAATPATIQVKSHALSTAC